MQCNTVTFTAVDGHALSLPLRPLLDRGAVVASKINGQEISNVMHAQNQLWIPGLPAKFFIRDILDIQFTEETNPPTVPDFIDDGHDFVNRPNVALKAAYVVPVNQPMLLEGWANDYDKAITAVELSFDEGETWTLCSTQGATAERWVWWRFKFTPFTAGRHKVLARAVNEDGEKSPSPAAHFFEVIPDGFSPNGTDGRLQKYESSSR